VLEKSYRAAQGMAVKPVWAVSAFSRLAAARTNL